MLKRLLLLFFTLSPLMAGAMEKKYNFHKVDENLFRSALIENSEALNSLIDKYKIKQIYALTHKNEYRIQRIVREKEINWKFLSLPSSKVPELNDFCELVTAMENISQPTLVHDRDGQNRTGFFSATYLILNNKSEDALEQFSSWTYGYWRIFHCICSIGGENFLEKFRSYYVKLKKLIEEESFDANSLSEEEQALLLEKIDKPAQMYYEHDLFEYALEAIKIIG